MHTKTIKQISDSFTRPANTTAYSANDLVANSTTAGSVVPLSFNLGEGGSHIVGIRVEKTDETDVALADFTLNLYGSSPTVANGDNGAISTDIADKIATIDMQTVMVAGTDDAYVLLNYGDTGFLQGMYTDKRVIFGLLEANAAYVPASGEVFTVYLTYEN
jgi:flagellin-like hook-associated protein FlgL